MESSNEIKEYDRIIKESIKEGFFDEEEKFEYDILNDSNILNEETNLYENETQNLYSFNVYFYIRINEKYENIILIESDDFNINVQCVSDLILNIVKKINLKKINITYENNEFILSLKEYENIDFYENNYEIKPCDKISHIPKYDYPCFSSTSLLDEVVGQEISLVIKKTSNIKLLQKSKDTLK